MRKVNRVVRFLKDFVSDFLSFVGDFLDWFCFETPLLVVFIAIGVVFWFVWSCWHSATYGEISTESYREIQALAAEYPEKIRPMVLSALKSENKIIGKERSEILSKHQELLKELMKRQIENCEPPKPCEKQ